MASERDEEGISLIQSCTDNTPPALESQDTRVCQVPHTEGKRKWQFRTIGSSHLVIILVWGFIIDCSLRLTDYRLQYPHMQLENMQLEEDNSVSPWLTHWSEIATSVTFAISCPLAGLLAEVAVGRYRLISHSLKALWVLSIAGSALSICEHCLSRAGNTMYNVQFFLVALPAVALKGAFLANAIPLGLDQIIHGSITATCAFILWLGWISFGSGYSIATLLAPVLYKCSHMPTSDVAVILSILPVILLSIGLIIDFYFHHKLIQEPVSTNPVSLIVKVMKYAARHKSPVQRSAFTYCENKLPSRMDNGKSKYGGPFTTEQVEDVKTFWRILVIILVLSSFNLAIAPLFESAASLEKNFSGFSSQTHCLQASTSSTYTPYTFITYSIPLYELLIYPCLRKSGPTILQSAGIGAAVVVSTSVSGMMVETYRQVAHNGSVECMFEQQKVTETDINHFIVGIPFNFLLGFTTILLYTSNLQFICAQAPYNMKGLLIGLSYMLQTLFSTLGTVLYVAWLNGWLEALYTPTCGTWFYLCTLVVSVALSVLLSWIVRRYKTRERDEITSEQKLVEDLYYKYNKKERIASFRLVPYQL